MTDLIKAKSLLSPEVILRKNSWLFSRFSLALTLSCAFATSISLADASDLGKTTQFFRAQALQNIASGREEDALESYKTAIKVARVQYGSESTYLSELYFEMGNLARSNGQSEIAQNCYKSAVKYRPNDIPARLQLADLERNTKNIREAFDDSKKAFQINQNSPIARKGLMLCLQQCGRPAEAAQIAATLHRTGKVGKFSNLPKLPDNSQPESEPVSSPKGAPLVTSAVAVSPTSALHWAPDIKKKIDEAQAKKNKEARAAEEARKKQQLEEAQKAESDRRNQQHKKDEADHKSRQKTKKEEKANSARKNEDKKQSKGKPAFVEAEVNAGTLKTTAKTISATRAEDKTTEKNEKPASKGHLGVGAVTEKVEKPAEEKHESSVSENEPAKPKAQPQERQQPTSSMIPSVPSVPNPMPVEKKGSHPRLGKTGLVPPPPATPFFAAPSFPPPQGFQMQAPQTAPAPPKPRKSKPAVKEAAKDSSSEDAGSQPKGPSEDPDFLINWGGDSGKKKHSK